MEEHGDKEIVTTEYEERMGKAYEKQIDGIIFPSKESEGVLILW